MNLDEVRTSSKHRLPGFGPLAACICRSRHGTRARESSATTGTGTRAGHAGFGVAADRNHERRVNEPAPLMASWLVVSSTSGATAPRIHCSWGMQTLFSVDWRSTAATSRAVHESARVSSRCRNNDYSSRRRNEACIRQHSFVKNRRVERRTNGTRSSSEWAMLVASESRSN